MTKLLRLPVVTEITGLKRSAIYQKMDEGIFPRPVKLGSRSVAWRSDDIQKWINERPVAGG
ncbi:MAG: AlpA family transcriptional regulator [Proteobacteria bacterium]|nr:AlpA family transcriptional regulator [Pseudomonadota bacterium]MBU0968581.1 AlpA family transcriptional regulator [Pseudomonadota bacterium]